MPIPGPTSRSAPPSAEPCRCGGSLQSTGALRRRLARHPRSRAWTPRTRHGDQRSRCRVGRPRDDDRPSWRSSSCRSIRPPRDLGGRMNPAELEILRTAFAFIPEEMGVALQRSAYSPNIKERMDPSCALFDETGRMLSQAEHIPVHLGSMPASVEAVLHDFPGTLREGDQVILNDPYHGGTHLPDVTLVRPVFALGTLLGFAANRAHHADIGGIAPGSMPADASRLDEEGLVLEPQKFLDRGRGQARLLEPFRHETLNPEERLPALPPPIAANERRARPRPVAAPKRGPSGPRSHADEL